MAVPMVVFGFLAIWTPNDDGPTFCPFALITGVACPGCGMSRALAWLVRGEVETSLRYHPLAPLVAAGLVVAAVWGWFWGRRGWKTPPLMLVNLGMIGFALLLMLVWAVRIATGILPPV